MRRSEWEDRCKRHPEHRTSKGVCPYCLRDRLAHLSASSSATTTTRASSSSAPTSPCSSGGSSPPPQYRAALSADVSSVHVVVAGSSFADVAAFSQPLMPTSANKKPPPASQDEPARGKGEAKRRKSGKKKKIGRFLSRLVGAERRRHTGDGGGDGDGAELFHSRTMKEKTASKWVFF
ncbi:hypothetical protein Zm00014a_029083 [Zea mays]|uniref:Uncharacterized protein n=2 Tax=Zea mays TaxID=4577 RepID=B4G0Y0_MAIZE|nr:uncharacterized protein LOC100275925 [Zea mays]ACF88023.1 unknown [Zea mays]ONL94442.1 hypothetical protein ZEAMMB73_Zm00001d027992 [Zea mays]PWZ53132.1 hypothetical protein Zm00014a_029083 [Zea mays]|eukprot:NP_001158922.1 uncharacterized protein LOC100275925 [Zea mays]